MRNDGGTAQHEAGSVGIFADGFQGAVSIRWGIGSSDTPAGGAGPACLMITESLFWVCAAFTAYIYAGYALLLALAGRLLKRPPRKAPVEPTVSLLVAAYNEADVIEQKIRNALELDYPAARLEIVVACDGDRKSVV